jgi:hypothetical protein
MTIHETVEKFKQQLDQWDADLSRWETSTREAGVQFNEGLKKQMADIRERSEEMRRRFNEVEHAAGAAAEDVKESMELAWDAIKMGFYAVRSEFESAESSQSASHTGSPPVSSASATGAEPRVLNGGGGKTA